MKLVVLILVVIFAIALDLVHASLIVVVIIVVVIITIIVVVVVVVGRVGAWNRELRSETDLDSKIGADPNRVARLIQIALFIAKRARAVGVKRQRVESETENAGARLLLGRDVIGCARNTRRQNTHKYLARTQKKCLLCMARFHC